MRKYFAACLAFILFSGPAWGATLYSLGVDGEFLESVGISGTFMGTGEGSLDSGIMTYTHTGNMVVAGGLEAIVTYSGSFDLVAETGSVESTDCTYVSGFSNLCDSLILNTLINLNVSFVSAVSGTPIIVIADDSQAEFTHTFVQVIPIPAAVWLFGSAFWVLGFMHRLRRPKC